MYAMNLNFKLTSQKSNLAHYEENMENSLYILQWGEQVCAKAMCDTNDMLCTQEKFVLAARTRRVRTFCTEHRKQQIITTSHHNK
jgi:hypothetical protein